MFSELALAYSSMPVEEKKYKILEFLHAHECHSGALAHG